MFEDYRQQIKTRFEKLGYHAEWHLLTASDFDVPQLRPRVVIAATRKDIAHHFKWPTGTGHNPPTVGEVPYDLITQRGWKGASAWKRRAGEIAPAPRPLAC